MFGLWGNYKKKPCSIIERALNKFLPGLTNPLYTLFWPCLLLLLQGPLLHLTLL
jgi:hypothetical protein